MTAVKRENQRGIALLLVLWVLAILMAIVLSFSFLTRTDITSTLAYSRAVKKGLIAEAGLHRAITELFNRKENRLLEEAPPWMGDGRPYREDFGAGHFIVRITDETGKVDINAAPDVLLRKIMENRGVEAGDIDIIIDSIMDWKDPDDLYRLSGAESDYYQSLENPYHAKNSRFETPEELILVRGITRELLYGDGGRGGIIDLFTTVSGSARINVAAAPKEVLMAIPGMTETVADGIIEQRKSGGIRTVRDLQSAVGVSYGLMSRYITVSEGRAFTIDATGYETGSDWGYPIRATVVIETSGGYRFAYYKKPVYAGTVQ